MYSYILLFPQFVRTSDFLHMGLFDMGHCLYNINKATNISRYFYWLITDRIGLCDVYSHRRPSIFKRMLISDNAKLTSLVVV
jgi:hypothetical protein